MNFRTIAFAILIMVILAGGVLMGEVPHCINYQGYLADASGVAVDDGIYNISFNIYGSSSGTDLLWSSGARAVQVTDGIFSYILGSNTALPADLFVGDTARYLGITIGADPEMTPRTKLMSSIYTQHAAIADNVVMPATFDGDGHFTGDLTVDGNLNVPGGLGDITEVGAGSGLTGGGTSGAVELSVPVNGITSSHIQNSSIVDNDISASADIAPTKINGTAAVLQGTNTFNGVNYFNAELTMNGSELAYRRGGMHRWRLREGESTGLEFYQVYDDAGVLRNRTVMEIGDYGNIGIGDIYSGYKFYIHYTENKADAIHGIRTEIYNEGNGGVTAGYFKAANSGSSGSTCTGVYGAAGTNCITRVGVRAHGGTSDPELTTGTSYGLRATAYNGNKAYGVYGYASFATTNWSGYFSGNCRVTGTFDNSKSTMRIDHPSDPENKVLEHATINAPEMLNVYSGNITTDLNGIAVVQLPDYFESLNEDFRYQLTVIGSFAQAIIKEKIANNQFVVATSEPNIEVSWQVTGVRKDAFAQTHPVIVESEKIAEEKGYYINPEAFGLDETRSTEYATNPEFRKEIDERREGVNESE